MIPELEHHCGSWVVTNRDNGTRREFFNRANVEKCAAHPETYLVETAATYLVRINAEMAEVSAHPMQPEYPVSPAAPHRLGVGRRE